MLKIIPLFALAALLTGCTMPGSGSSKPKFIVFNVNPSPLDDVTMVYFPRTGHSSGFTQCRIDMDGGGTIELRGGSSQRVLDSFWTDPEAGNWDDAHFDRLSLRRDEIALLLQRIVDFGAFPAKESKTPEEAPARPYMILQAQIGRHSSRQVTADPNLIRIADLLLSEFAADDAHGR